MPIFYILLQSKTEWTYWDALHEVLLSTDLKLDPANIHYDFEKGLINAIKDQFPNAKVVGCLFHFKQALYRKMRYVVISRESVS